MLAVWFTRQLLVDGLVQGLVYGLLAIAIVLTYRSNKIINFAVGGMGLVGAGVLVVAASNYGFPYWISLLIALVVGVIYGAVIEVAVIRRLKKAPRVIVLVATIGVSSLSLAILNSYPDVVGAGTKFPQAIGSVFNVAGVRLRGSQLLVVVVAPVLALILAWFLNRTLLGRAVRAAADNPDLARLRTVNPALISTLVWCIAGLLATVSMVLIGGLDGTAGNLQTLGPATLLRALVAALIGRFTSIKAAFAAAILIGVGQALLQFNFLQTQGLFDLVLLAVVLVGVAVQSQRRSESDVSFSVAPTVDAMPERLRSIFWVRHLDRITMLVLAAVAVVIPLVVTLPSRHQLYALIAAWAICALSLTVLTGWSGQLSLGQMTFAGLGAFTAAALTRGLRVDAKVSGHRLFAFEMYPIPFALSIVLAAVLTMVLSVVIGIGALRVKGHLLAVTTFAFAIAAQAFLFRMDVFSDGSTTTVPFRRGSLFGLDLDSQRTYFYVVLGVLGIVVMVLSRLKRTGFGRVTVAVRDNPDTAAGYTVRPVASKLRAFAVAGFIAGLGGGMLSGATERISLGDSPYVVGASLTLVAASVIGGMSSIAGAIVGAIWVVGLPSLFPDNDLLPLLSSSLGLLILLLYFPGGLVQVAFRVRSALYRWLERRLPPVTKTSTTAPPSLVVTEREPMSVPVALRATGVTVRFGGVVANDAVSIEIGAGEVVGLIGANGAGKSTLMNALGGFVHCTGQIELLGSDVSRRSAADRARAGLGRTFQAASLFPELTVRQTVEVALEARHRTSLLATALLLPHASRGERRRRVEAGELIDFLGLGRYADRMIGELSTGTRRIVELAGLLALDARVLCLDEPTAGVAQRETEALAPLLLDIRRHLGASMLVIEHDMPFIMNLSDRIYCLELGRVIAQGDPAAVRADPAVIASYLGTDERAIARSGTSTT